MTEYVSKLTRDSQGVYCDKFGQRIFTTDQVADCLLVNPKLDISQCQVIDAREYIKSRSELLAGFEIPETYDPEILKKSQFEFDTELQNHWLAPAEYQDLDILTWLLEKAPNDLARERVCVEYKLYEQYQLVNFLRFLKYLTDVLKENSVIQGLGRGSSVSSYCLFLLGVHRIDPIKYNLDISEFLR
jgi:DNA polymerase III alpha subunit